MSKRTQKPQWIRMEEQQPDTGQRIAAYWAAPTLRQSPLYHDSDLIMAIAGEKETIAGEKFIAILETHRSRNGMSVRNIEWRKVRKSERYWELNNPNICWIPVTELPTNLPKKPKSRSNK